MADKPCMADKPLPLDFDIDIGKLSSNQVIMGNLNNCSKNLKEVELETNTPYLRKGNWVDNFVAEGFPLNLEAWFLFYITYYFIAIIIKLL